MNKNTVQRAGVNSTDEYKTPLILRHELGYPLACTRQRLLYYTITFLLFATRIVSAWDPAISMIGGPLSELQWRRAICCRVLENARLRFLSPRPQETAFL